MRVKRTASTTFLCILIAACTLISGCMLKRDPAAVHLNRAAKLMQHKDYARAKTSIESAIEVSHSPQDTYYSAITLYQQSNRYKDACEVAQRFEGSKFFRKLPRQEKVLFCADLAATFYQTKDLPQMEHYYRLALALSPDSPQLLNSLGYIFADEGIKLDQALKLTKRAVELSPDDGAIVDSLGWAQYKMGDYKSAVKTLQKAVLLAPDVSELRYHLGAVYVKQGRIPEARIELSKALLLDEKMTEAARLLKTFHK